MNNPRSPGGGDTGADRLRMLGGSDFYMCPAALPSNSQITACALDRRADHELAHGRHGLAELLAHRANELRQAGAG